MKNEINFISVYLLKCTFRLIRRNFYAVLLLILLYWFIFTSVPNTPRRVTESVDSFKRVFEDEQLTEWTPASKSKSRPEEPGDLGQAVMLPTNLTSQVKLRFTEHYFNIVANELMPMDRTLYDFREQECKKFEYPNKLPTMSVIIIHHNEARSALTRTVWSVINRTPKELLAEIILVDDCSDRENLRDFLEHHFETVELRIMKLRSEKRIGLVGARLLGAERATGQVLAFLDSHCEANDGWAEPLLYAISLDRKVFVEPRIDHINPNTMAVTPESSNEHGFFDLKLFYFSQKQGDSVATIKPRTTVAMAGGLFAVDRDYFFLLGAYDDQMAIWGGENIELSLRIWTCGGQLLKAPCSRVAHIFRDNSPYTHPGGQYQTIYTNMARVADVWLDDHKEIFYLMVPDARNMRTDVSERQKMRKRLKCKSFQWFLDSIYPQSGFNKPHFFIGQIRNPIKNVCLDTGSFQTSSLLVQPCHGLRGNQGFMFTNDHELRSGSYCLAATSVGKAVQKNHCKDESEGNDQYWTHDKSTNTIKHGAGENCLTFHEDEIVIDACSGEDNQKWFLE